MKRNGIVVMGSDERDQQVRLRPVRANLYRRAQPGYEQSRRLRDIIGVYLGLGRWHVWVYFRERDADNSTYAQGAWLTIVDIQRDHELAEAGKR